MSGTVPRVWVDGGDGWKELPGVRSVSLDYDPPDWLDGYRTGARLGLFAVAASLLPTPVERALRILAPHLAREPLYRRSL